MNESVTTSREERSAGVIATVTVDYPGRLNILSLARARSLRDRFTELAGDQSLRAVVLRGAGERAFIGGADINDMVDLDPDRARRFIRTIHEACQAIRDLPVPVIARISGYCLGAGLEVAAACDLRLASSASTFGMPEVRVGIPSVIEAALLPGIIGWGRTRELIYTGESWDAAQALDAGFVERVVTPSALDEAVEGWLGSILAGGPHAIRAQKELIRRWERLPIDQAIEAGVQEFARAFEDDEPNRYMKQFLDRPR